MIISKRSHLDKLEQERHLQPLLEELCTCDHSQLAEKLAAHMEWNSPQGNLLHWVRLLNHFDEILEKQITKYGLAGENPRPTEMKTEDAELISACLDFTKLLLDHCTNRSLYASPERVFQLVSTPCLKVKLAALEVALCLGERYTCGGHYKKFAAPKNLRRGLLETVKSFPPPVPASFVQTQLEQGQRVAKKGGPKSAMAPYRWIDMLDLEKKYPLQWRSIHFEYFRAEPTKEKHTNKLKHKGLKKDISEISTSGIQATQGTPEPASDLATAGTHDEGAAVFRVPEDHVRRLSLSQIYERASAQLPSTAWGSFALAALNAKAFAFGGDTKDHDVLALRVQLLRVKFLAAACLACFCTADFTSGHWLESEPSALAYIVDFLAPMHATRVPGELFCAASQAVRALASKRVWGSEIVRHLGANVHHGVVYAVLRGLRQSHDYSELAVRDAGYQALFSALGDLVESSLAARLVAGGLLRELSEFLRVDGTENKVIREASNAASRVLAQLLSGSPEFVGAFADDSGLPLVVTAVTREVNYALAHPRNSGEEPSLVPLLHSASVAQIQYLRTLLDFVSQLASSDLGDRLRTMFDSPLLAGLAQIVLHPRVFGPVVVSAALDDVAQILHNEPTAFAILDEAGVVAAVLENYADLFMPDGELLLALLEVLGALSLNTAGLRKVIDADVIKVFFRFFYDLASARDAVKSDMATNMGCSMDELGRHNPLLRPLIMNEVISLVNSFGAYANDQLSPIRFYSSERGNMYKCSTDLVIPHEPGQEEIESWEGMHSSNLIDNVFMFLNGLLQDTGQWGKEVIKNVPFSSWESFFTMPNTPFDFTVSTGVLNLIAVLRYLDDEVQSYGLSQILESLSERLKSPRVISFLEYNETQSYFAELENNPQEATILLKELNCLSNLLFVLTEIYLNPSSISNETNLALFDYLSSDMQLIEKLVSILQVSMVEEINIRSVLPDEVMEKTSPSIFYAIKSSAIRVFPREPPSDLSLDELSSAKFKNTLQLRFMMDSISNNTMVILSCVSKSCMHRRQDFFSDSWRRTSVIASRQLAISLCDMSQTPGRLQEQNKLEYFLRFMYIISFISTYKDRGKEAIATSFVSFFYFTTDLAERIVNSTIAVFDELLSVSEDSLKNTKDLKFIQNTPASIGANALQISLTFINKILTVTALNKFPLMSYYFNKKYCDNENYPVYGIQLQTAVQAYRLLSHVLGSNSKFCQMNNYTLIGSIPFKVIEQLVDIVQHASMPFSTDEYYPLKEDWMTPAHKEVEYLIGSCGMSEDDATQLLTFSKSIQNLESVCAKGQGMEISAWPSIEKKLRESNLSELFNYQPIHTGSSHDLEIARIEEEYQIFSVALIQIAAFTSGDIQRNIVLAYSAQGKMPDVVTNVVEAIEKLRQVEEGLEKDHTANLIDILEGIICFDPFDEKKHQQTQNALNKFYEMFLYDLKQDPRIADSEYCAAGLSLLLPIVSQTLPTEFSGRLPYFNVILPESFIERFANAVLQLQPTSNVNSATLLGRHLYLLAKHDACKERVIKSPLLSCLIRNMKTLLESADHHRHEPLQDSVVLAVRTCFDDVRYIRNIFSAELFRVMKKHSGSRRDLGQVIHECRSLIGRDPYQFLEVASGMVLLENYDGRAATGGEKVVLLSEEELKNKRSSADVEMTDSQVTGGGINSSGLVNLFLFELMNVAKEDWYTTPEDKNSKEEPEKIEKKKDESDFRTLIRNKKFAYMTFLLQGLCELVGSYNAAKLEFITFTKKFKNEDRNKPRLTSLNFFIHQLIPSYVFMNTTDAEYQRRESISTLAKLTLLALVSTTVQENDTEPDPKKEDADMSIVRKLMVDMLLKILKETVFQISDITRAYSKIYDVFDLCSCLLSSKFRGLCAPLLTSSVTKADQFYIASAFLDSNLAGQVASVISSVDLNFPEVNKVVCMGLKTLSSLAKVKLSNVDLFEASSTIDKDDDDIEDDEDRDETPDLFRNSTLGMYDLDLETDEEDEFYQDQSLIPMSGSDIDEEESDNSDVMTYSDLGSVLEEGELIEDEEEDDDMEDRDEFEGFDSDDSENHANFIGELEIASGEGSEFGDEDSENIISSPDDYEEDRDEGETDYSDAELEHWEELLADTSRQDEPRGRARFGEPRDFDDEDVGISGLDSELNSASEDEEELGFASINDRARATRESITSIFNAIRPGGSPILSLNPSGLLAGTIQIGSTRQHDAAFPQLDAAFQALLNTEQAKTPADHMLLKSSAERWSEVFNIYFRRPDPEFLESARSKLKELIKADSLKIYQKKADEKEKLRKKRAEAIQKKREKARLQREAEAREREAAQETIDVASREPVMLWIGNRQVDISGTDIDPGFFEALPDDMREEVFTQHVRERRANAGSTGGEVREIDPDFLEALPEQIRNEILQQESMSRRFSAAGFGMDDDDEDEFDSELDEELESDGEGDILTTSAQGESTRMANETSHESEKQIKKKVFAVPILDRAGVATLIKLLFLPRPINQRDQFYRTIVSVCKNKQTRSDVVSMIIAVLHDGMMSQKALEKAFNYVNAKSRRADQPQPSSSFPIGCSPVTVGVQFIEALMFLLEHVPALRLYLLTEHENPLLLKKQSKKKHKKLSSGEEKYPINLLFKLLDNPLLGEEYLFMDTLSSVLNFATKPLLMLRAKTKPAPVSFATGFVPDENLRLVIKILASNECVNSTFRSTISSMHHLSLLPGAQQVLYTELSTKASELGELIIEDLKLLTNDLKNTAKIESHDNAVVDKFTAQSSDQSKLLRVLTALDYMFESQKSDSEDKAMKDKKNDLTNVYKYLRLGTLWTALSDCLRVLEENLHLSHVATALLPLIEALMVICKHSKVKELPIKDMMKFEIKKVDFTKEPIESLFFSFTDEHKKILNQMVRTNPNLMSGPFSMLVRNSRVLEFDNKRNYFNRQLHNEKEAGTKLSINIRREQVFLDSYRALFFKSTQDFKKAHLEINFKGEAGIDAGGVTREWYQVLSRQMFNPDYALFTAVASDENTYHPNRTSYINPEHLSFFKFIGRTIGKAIYDGCFLDCHFSRAVYKNILDRSVSLKDMENLDLEYSKSLMWMLENDITDIITEDFSVESDDYGEHKIIELVPNGKNIPVTEENKHEYVRLIVEYRLQTSVSEQMNNFITGFHEIIPRDLVAIFDEQELELLISGLPDIDVQDWQNNTMYNNYSASSEQIQWFWRAVKSFDNEERAKLLQFSTGTSKVPLNGFKDLRGANGVCKFSIHRDYGAKDRLPSSHTCFNQIDLPVYESYETLRGSVLLALSEGHEGFQLA